MDGQCRLCLQKKSLQRSHLLPAAVFKRIQSAQNAAPVVISRHRQTAVEINKQLWMHLLCQDCEGRFSKYGENDVLRWYSCSEQEFPLRDALEKLIPIDVLEGMRRWSPDQLPPEFNVNSLYYFAISMFWRNSVANAQPGEVNTYKGALGSHYEEQFRRYLLDEISLPKECHLLIGVQMSKPTMTMSYPPSMEKVSELDRRIFRHGFVIPGLRFMAIVGGPALLAAKSSSLWPLFVEWDYWQSPAHSTMLQMVGMAKRKGKLANR